MVQSFLPSMPPLNVIKPSVNSSSFLVLFFTSTLVCVVGGLGGIQPSPFLIFGLLSVLFVTDTENFQWYR
jgi:hypothetical protein